MIGKRIEITDKESVYYGHWGFIKFWDGEVFHVSGGSTSTSFGELTPIFDRDQFIVRRKKRRWILMSTLEKAIELAAKAHAGQLDKVGQPYILHLLRVMLQLEMYAMLKGLEEINKRGIKKVKVRGDNKDVYRILKGKKEARSTDFLKVKIENFIDCFEYIKINWIPREVNKDADLMSKIPTK